MANTYKALSTVTVGAGGAASISFTNIPQTYTDLVVKLSPKTTRTDADYEGIVCSINSNTTDANYSRQTLMNNSGSAVGGAGTDRYVGWTATNSGTAPNVFGNFEIYFANYASPNAKVYSSDFVNEGNFSAVTAQGIMANSTTITSAITSLTFTAISNNLTQYSTATLYGVFNADVSSAPATPTIGTATTVTDTIATVGFTGVSNAASYTATSTPGSITATGTTSPLTVSGLTGNTSYTFAVKSNNPFGSSANSAASNSITTLSPSFESIATTTVSAGGVSTITFSSIPSTYKHLQIRGIARTTNGGAIDATNITAQFNGDTNTNYAWHNMYSNGNSSVTGNDYSINNSLALCGKAISASAVANTFSPVICDFLDYADTNKFKTVRVWTGALDSDASATGVIFYNSNLYRSTNAISSIVLSANFAQYSQIALYGIK